MRHEKSIRSPCQLNGYLIILHKRILIKLCQICLYSAVRIVVSINLYFMLAVNIKFCIATFSTGKPFKIQLLKKKKKKKRKIIKKVEGSEVVGPKIFRSNSQASMIFITYTLLKCLLKISS